MKQQSIPEPVLRRLPRYYRYIQKLLRAGTQIISSTEIGTALGITASQVRYDFNLIGAFGQRGAGYIVGELNEYLAKLLGIRQNYHAILLGAGNIGNALLQGFVFEDCGMSLDVAFDVSPDLVGTMIGNTPILDICQLSDYMEHHVVDIVVLAIPRQLVPSVLKQIDGYPIKGIWNFTNCDLSIHTDRPIVENVHPADSLARLSYRLAERKWQIKEENVSSREITSIRSMEEYQSAFHIA